MHSNKPEIHAPLSLKNLSLPSSRQIAQTMFDFGPSLKMESEINKIAESINAFLHIKLTSLEECAKAINSSSLGQLQGWPKTDKILAKSINFQVYLDRIVQPLLDILKKFDTEEFRFNAQRLYKCRPYLNKIDPTVSVKDVLLAIEGIPEEEYESVLLRKFGKTKKRFNSRRLAREANKTFRLLVNLFTIYTFLIFIGIPLPATFPEFIEAIFQQPVESIQQTQKNPPISKGFDKKILVASTRKRKKRSNKKRSK